MAILKPDNKTTFGSVTVNEYLLTRHNPNRIAMSSVSMEGKTIAIECIMSSAYNATDKKSEDNCARLAAALLKKYNLDIDHLYTHTHWLNVRDGRSGSVDYLNTARNSYKMCPLYILPHWAEFKKKVQGYMNAGSTVTPASAVKQLYRVRKSRSDAKSQIGAFSSLENVKKVCKTGYAVFESSGKQVYLQGSPLTKLPVKSFKVNGQMVWNVKNV